MWRNYFFQIQSKYNMRISLSSPLVVRFDGKDVTKNKNINFLYDFKGGFTNSLEETVKEFTNKYEAYSIFGSDEVSFIFPKPLLLVSDMDSENCIHTNEIISVFSQMFYEKFNSKFLDTQKILWHGKCFSIKDDKVASYIKYRSSSIENVMTTYFLKRKDIVNAGNFKKEERIERCKSFDDYNVLEKLKDGILYYNGNKINLQSFLSNNQIDIETNDDAKEIKFIGLDDF